MADTIFEGDKPVDTNAVPQDPQGNTQVTPQSDNALLGALVGEGRKYKSVDELAKAYISADGFIEKLKQENHALREKATQAATIDEVLERLQNQNKTQQDHVVPASQDAVSVTDIAKIVEQTIEGRETAKQREGNIRKADAKMKEVFGEKAAEVYKNAASSPELHEAYMKLAAADPDKFVALFAPNVPKNTGGMTQPTLSTTAIATAPASRENVEGAKEFFDKVRRENPNQYYSQEFQLKMDKAVRNNPGLYYGR